MRQGTVRLSKSEVCEITSGQTDIQVFENKDLRPCSHTHGPGGYKAYPPVFGYEARTLVRTLLSNKANLCVTKWTGLGAV